MTTPELALSDESIGELAGLGLTLQRCFVAGLTVKLAESGVSFAQFSLLSHINSSGALSMTEIAAKMSHTTAAATGVVSRLERLEYVERFSDTNDRRKVLIRIKPKGVELVEIIHLDVMGNMKKVLADLTHEEQRMWLQVYRKILAYCQKLNPAGNGTLPARD
jgi:DNA-binding MarR family transcriptional regulator